MTAEEDHPLMLGKRATSGHRAKTRTADRSRPGLLGTTFLALAFGFAALGASAEDHVKTAHGVSTFGDLKYEAGFAHFDYVNPQAPKGGEFSTWAFGTFDSLTPYILKGNAAAGATVFYDSLLTGNLEEPDAMYGSTVTAQDVVFSYNILLEKGTPTYKTTFRHFQSVGALDDHTVKFTFDPEGPLRELLMTA